MAFDVDAVRAQFPILQRQVNGKPLVYLDSAASAQKPRAVIDAMTAVMEGSYSNVHRGLHTLANETTDAYEAARKSVAKFINAGEHEIVFTKGGTEAINLVASGIGASLVEGDEILLTVMEHHANIVPWHFLRERKGVVLKFIPVLDDGTLDLAALPDLLTPRTKVVALTQMSNVLGTINPVAEIARMAHAAGAKVLVDGCQGVVHLDIDVKALDVDFYVFSSHKLYGPTGIGVLYGKAEALAQLPPYQGGGEMIGEVRLEAITYADPPHRFEAGTPPIIEAIGLGAAIEWLNTIDRKAAAEHEAKLYARVREGLKGYNWLRVIGEAPGKGAIMAFTVDGAHAHDVAQILDRYGVAVRAGTHCAEPLMRRFGLTASARASFALYNTEGEADAFVDALTRTQAFFA
ncbi:cysteine desulfurase [Phenylobacterium sp. Root77]|uniref:aminotransferase class V-fold PLP-dependent enzyme n=1 Tax=unclassified Phenylobacterium TaxID=2640670 RepID=UPI0006FD0072|nr:MULTISPECIES: SufS family cysteine desulfurase [unclassified Phenylobacterium]KQW71480.1 cysteine desulfurase [Phenylobacterium sp. Root1277]KQW94400.1 cysteine desulfurase [Phenylobacterium sp. Root1290]KRC44094.1 cysteine desulfurase [Phenylobacterium sp. Root77]